MNKIVVFDFDGTLSYEDSLTELFLQEMKGIKFAYRIYYFALKILAKLCIISVKIEKTLMIKLLFNSDVNKFKMACETQAYNFKLNPIFSRIQDYLNNGDRVIILSASSIFFLEKVFERMNVEIVGTTINSNGNKFLSIDCHPFYKEKVICILSMGISLIDEMYYDSKWDECLIPMCKEWHKVNCGAIVYNGKKDRELKFK